MGQDFDKTDENLKVGYRPVLRKRRIKKVLSPLQRLKNKLRYRKNRFKIRRYQKLWRRKNAPRLRKMRKLRRKK